MLTPGPTIRWAHCVKAHLHQNLTQALIVKADSLGNMRRWLPRAINLLAARTLFGSRALA